MTYIWLRERSKPLQTNSMPLIVATKSACSRGHAPLHRQQSQAAHTQAMYTRVISILSLRLLASTSSSRKALRRAWRGCSRLSEVSGVKIYTVTIACMVDPAQHRDLVVARELSTCSETTSRLRCAQFRARHVHNLRKYVKRCIHIIVSASRVQFYKPKKSRWQTQMQSH
jgi:hypothetical protein